jgi:hypothetical protein
MAAFAKSCLTQIAEAISLIRSVLASAIEAGESENPE